MSFVGCDAGPKLAKKGATLYRRLCMWAVECSGKVQGSMTGRPSKGNIVLRRSSRYDISTSSGRTEGKMILVRW